MSTLSVHVKYGSRDAVVAALLRLGIAHGSPVAVWPPRRLPYGMFASPVRNGWVSLWSPLGDPREWLPRLTATLECPGVLLEVIESQFWIAELFQGAEFLGCLELPTAAVAWDHLWAQAADSLQAEGLAEPWEDEARLGARMDEIAATVEYREELRHRREEWPEPAALRPFLPPHATLDHAWELLTAIDRRDADGNGEESSPYAEDYLEDFASYLGIRDAAWNPFADAEAFAEGEYEEEEGLPDGWREFVVLPVAQLPIISG